MRKLPMNQQLPTAEAPAFLLPVHRAEDFRVVDGVNRGDPLGLTDRLLLDDVYRLRGGAPSLRLLVRSSGPGGALTIAPGSEAGTPGTALRADGLLTLMAGDGSTIDAIVLAEAGNGDAPGAYLMPLAPLQPAESYTLVSAERKGAEERLADLACVSFARGTRVLTAGRGQVPIEKLAVGDRIMTRDHGPQPIRWIGRQTLRATGAFAPIVIRKGVLNNTADLTLGSNHRLFIYQRRDETGAGRPEITVRAGQLVDGENVVQRPGGFIDYFQLLFDRHEIIYVEGIAAESMLADPRLTPRLPRELRDRLRPARLQGARRNDLPEEALPRTQAAALLRRASEGQGR